MELIIINIMTINYAHYVLREKITLSNEKSNHFKMLTHIYKRKRLN